MEFFSGVGVDVDDDFFDLVFLLFREFSFFELVFQNFGNNFISTVALSSLDILDENIGKLSHMPRMFEYNMWGDAGTVDLEHIFFEDKELPPELFDVVLDGTTNRPEVIETGTSSVDFKSLEINVSSFDEVVQEFFVLGHFLELRD